MTIKKQRSLFNIFFTVFLLLFIIYLIFESYRFISGPKITIISPKNGSTVDTPDIQFDSIIKNATFITIDNRQVFTDNSGVFKDKLLLSPGYNIIVVEAEDKFRNKVTEKLELYRTKKETDISPIIEIQEASTTEKIFNTDEQNKLIE